MPVRHALILAGSLWETVRFFLVISLLAQVFGDAVQGTVPWLLLAGSSNLLLAAGGFMLSVFPGKYGELIGFLRLGKVLSVFSFVLLIASGAIEVSARIELLRLGPFSVNEGAVLFAIFVLDLLFLVALITWRREKHLRFPAATR